MTIRLTSASIWLAGRLRVVLGAAEVAAEEDLLLGPAEGQRADLAHAPLADHLARHVGGPLDVVAGAGRHVAEELLLGDAAAHHDGDRGVEVLLGVGVLVLGGKLLREAQRAAARNDRDLVDAGRRPAACAATSAWPPSWYAVLRFSSSVMIMDFRSGPIMTLSLAYSKSIISTFFLLKRAAFSAASLTRLARSAPEKPGVPRAMIVRSTFSASGDVARVDLQDLLAAAQVRPVDDDAAVEAAGAQERRIEDVGPVRGGDEDDALVGLEAVHLDEQRVQRLLALVVPAAEARAAVAADGVDLVDEDDAGRVLLALLEQVADARGADAHEHLDEVRARDREERARWPRRRPRGRGASCPCPEGRSGARPSGSCRRASGTSAGP